MVKDIILIYYYYNCTILFDIMQLENINIIDKEYVLVDGFDNELYCFHKYSPFLFRAQCDSNDLLPIVFIIK